MESRPNFVTAIAFCLAYDEHGGDLKAVAAAMEGYRPLAKWALSPADESPSPGDSCLPIGLIAGGATKIKGYVFESARLPEIRGASGLLDRINLEDTPQLWRKFGLEGCIIYANGGEVLAFAPASQAARLADEVERLYTRETLVAQSVAVHRVYTLRELREGLLSDEETDGSAVEALLGYNPAAKRTFGRLVTTLALAKFRRREGNADKDRDPELRAIGHFETVPFARRCSSCERRAAVVNAKVSADDDEDLPLCEPCARKRVFGMLARSEDARMTWWWDEQFNWRPDASEFSSWTTQFEKMLRERPDLRDAYAARVQDLHDVRAVRDLAEIGQTSKTKGFIGMVYADGNSVGQLIEERLETPDHYAEFAQALFDANKTAVFEALAENLHTSKIERKKVKEIPVHPFEILGIGGDDVLLILPAHAALKIACAIAAKVEARLPQYNLTRDEPGATGYPWERVQRCRGVSPAQQCAVSMSVGVVLADAHTPVFYLEELASQLLKSAKRRAKWLRRNYNYCGGTVDFLSLKSTTMISSTIEQFRSQAFSRSHGRLYARPYTIAEMEALLDSIRALKASGFPRSQLYRLRESLAVSKEQSTVDYLYFLSRDDRTRSAREMIEKKWSPTESRLPHPWRVQLEDKNQRETIWHDLVELYDFVATKEEEHGEDQD